MVFTISQLRSQGCSDAGICAVANSFQSSGNLLKNNIEFAGIIGAGQADVKYFSPYLAYTRNLNDRFALTTKITFNLADGSFGKRATFGDAYLIGNYQWKSGKTAKWSTILAIKFPFTSANLKINGYSLPMDYQASLGTFDLIVASNLNYKKWDFNAGIQLPVFNNNKNSYFAEFSGTNEFPSTNLFKRKPDALLRVTYSHIMNRFTFKPNVLLIYHLGQDSYETIYGQRENIPGSDGLTINANLIGAYAINARNSIELSVATPFVVRKVRPDGLTRSFTAGVIYKVSF